MSIADLMEAMTNAGAPMEAIILAVRALEDKDAALKAAEQAAADKRAAHAEWKRNNRAANKGMDSPSNVHGQSTDTPPNEYISNPPELSPDASHPP